MILPHKAETFAYTTSFTYNNLFHNVRKTTSKRRTLKFAYGGSVYLHHALINDLSALTKELYP